MFIKYYQIALISNYFKYYFKYPYLFILKKFFKKIFRISISLISFQGDPIGGNILNYLLEKSRVVHQSLGERNFHIFYQLIAGANEETLRKLYLKKNLDTYYYLSNGVSYFFYFIINQL